MPSMIGSSAAPTSDGQPPAYNPRRERLGRLRPNTESWALGGSLSLPVKLKAKVKDINTVDEKFRDLYVKNGDFYELDAEELDSHSSVSGVIKKKQELDTEIANIKADLAKYKDVDPAKYKQLLDAQAEAETKKAEAEGNWEALKKQMSDGHAQVVGEKDTRITQLTGALHDALVVQAATAAISAVAPKSVDLLLPHVVKNMKVVEVDGKFVAKVVDDKGQPRIRVNGSATEDLPLFSEKGASLLAEMKELPSFAPAFPASTAGGSGASAEGGAGAGTGTGTATQGKTISLPVGFTQEDYKRARQEQQKSGGSIVFAGDATSTGEQAGDQQQ